MAKFNANRSAAAAVLFIAFYTRVRDSQLYQDISNQLAIQSLPFFVSRTERLAMIDSLKLFSNRNT